MDEELKSENMQKKTSFLNGVLGEGRVRERRYADHMFIQMYFIMHRFVAKFSKNFFASDGKGALPP